MTQRLMTRKLWLIVFLLQIRLETAEEREARIKVIEKVEAAKHEGKVVHEKIERSKQGGK